MTEPPISEGVLTPGRAAAVPVAIQPATPKIERRRPAARNLSANAQV
jgi:hypothetical protein